MQSRLKTYLSHLNRQNKNNIATTMLAVLCLLLSGYLIITLVFWYNQYPQSQSYAADVIQWQADFETGNFTQLTTDGGGTISISGLADNIIATEPVHSGQFSAALTVYNADGLSEHPGVRLTRWGTTATPQQLPDSSYYSSWYYFPTFVYAKPMWDVFQWKQRRQNLNGTTTTDPVNVISLDAQTNSILKYRLQNKVARDGSYDGAGRRSTLSPISVPLAQWTHLECLYIWSRVKTGRVTCWQDGVQIWDIKNVQTEFSDEALHPTSITPKRSWTVNNYVEQSNPQTHTMFVDDMIISSSRIGTGTRSTAQPTSIQTPTPFPTNISISTASPAPTIVPTSTQGSDVMKPTMSITFPVNGSIVTRNSIVTIQAIASDNVGVAKVDFVVEGNNICTDTVAPYTCNWIVTSGVSDIDLTARAYDAAGNLSLQTIAVKSRRSLVYLPTIALPARAQCRSSAKCLVGGCPAQSPKG